MTRGREPTYSDEPLAQWIKSHLEARGWQHQDLAARLQKASRGRLDASGAKGLVHRATKGGRPNQANLALLAKVLGEPPPTDESALAQMHGHLEELREQLDASLLGQTELTEKLTVLEARVEKLEARRRAAPTAAKRPQSRSAR